ncbi:T9SS type A sorting domain-containing protein [Chryseobacterium taklimakanense]
MDIDLSAFGGGIYILTVTDSNGKTTSVKLMVK